MAKDDSFGQKEITVQLNNTVSYVLRPARLGPIPEERLRKLRAVSKALIEPAQEMLLATDDGGSPLLEPEELVAVLAVAALYVQIHDVIKTNRIPYGGLATEVFD